MDTGLSAWRVARLATAVRLAHVLLLLASDACFSDYDTSGPLASGLLLQTSQQPHGATLEAHAPNSAPSTPAHPRSLGQHAGSDGSMATHGDTPSSASPAAAPAAAAAAATPHASTAPSTPCALPAWARRLSSALAGLCVWDGVFFAQIAQTGYAYEQFYAFFPLLPALSGAGGRAWAPITSAMVNILAGVATAVLFARLSEAVLRDTRLASRATLLLLLGQACTFHAVAYTESLFACLTMAGLCCLYCPPGAGSCPPRGGTRRPPRGKAARGGASSAGDDSDSDVDADRARWRLGSPLAAAACFAAASLARSNGLINAGYLCHHALEGAAGEWQQRRQGGADEEVRAGGGRRRAGKRGAWWWAAACRRLVVGALLSALVGAPLLAMQAHGYAAFCCAPNPTGTQPGGDGTTGGVGTCGSGLLGAPPPSSHGDAHSPPGRSTGGGGGHGGSGHGGDGGGGGLSLLVEVFRPLVSWASGRGLCSAAAAATATPHGTGTLDGAPPPPRPWCAARVPRIYSFVQEHYWGVGLLRYWTPQQAPNFLLAAPALWLAAAGVFLHARANARHLLFGALMPLLPTQARRRDGGAAAAQARTRGFLAPGVGVHIYPWAFMAAASALVMHVQVATRFLSVCPAHYWFMAHLAGGGGSTSSGAGNGTGGSGSGRRWRMLLWGVCLTYTALGSLLFPNFYPWT